MGIPAGNIFDGFYFKEEKKPRRPLHGVFTFTLIFFQRLVV
jgi:hypothetical protein